MAEFNATTNKVFHYVGIQSEYAGLSEQLKKQVIFFCTDTEGVYKGAIIYNNKTYGSQLQVSDIGAINSVSYDEASHKVSIVLSNGQTKDVVLPLASNTSDGLMSKEDFDKLQGVTAGAQVNVIESVELDGAVQDITDKKVTLNTYKKETIDQKINAAVSSLYKVKGTKSSIEEVTTLTDAKVGDVWNVSTAFTMGGKKYPEGTNVVYTGSGESNEDKWDCLGGTVDLSPYATTQSVNTELVKKVDKVSGKSLVLDTDITKLSELKSQSELDTAIADAKKSGEDAKVIANSNTQSIATLKGKASAGYDTLEKIENKVKDLEASNIWYSITQ